MIFLSIQIISIDCIIMKVLSFNEKIERSVNLGKQYVKTGPNSIDFALNSSMIDYHNINIRPVS